MSDVAYYDVFGDVRQYRDGFIEAFREIFSGPPYNENFSYSQVFDQVWLPHVGRGLMEVALDPENRVLGFGCALKIQDESIPEVREYLNATAQKNLFTGDISRTWYISELGVLPEFREQGIGRGLLRTLAHFAMKYGAADYLLQTAPGDSRSHRFYETLGASKLPDSPCVDRIYFQGDWATLRRSLT